MSSLRAMSLARIRRGDWLTPRVAVNAVLLAVLALVPFYASLTSDPFLVTLFTRVLILALALYLLVMRTRLGMLIRAGASNREMVGALGVNIKLLYTLVFEMCIRDSPCRARSKAR